MNLFAETRSALRWVLQILRQFMRIVPGVTVAVVTCLTIARITRLLAFLLPLKVILLAGSEGIPRYFRPFLTPEHRQTGIILLSAAAIISYALTLFLEARSRRLSDGGGADLLSAANVMAVVANQRAEMQGIYVRFTQVVSATLFMVAGMLALALLNPVLAAYMFGLVMCFYLLTAWAFHGVTLLKRNRLAAFAEGKLNSYLSVLSSITFLSGFLIILYPFLTEAGGNVLVAIISVILMRHLMSSLTGALKDVVGLAQKQKLVDTLVLPDRQFHQVESNDQRTLRELFGRQAREELILRELADLRQPDESVRVEWLDPAGRGTADFAITFHGGEGAARHVRQRAFPPRLRRATENEDLLFRHIAREAVWAAPVVKRFMHGEYECIVYDAGTGVAPDHATLYKNHGDFIVSLWAAELPQALVRIYAASHKPMHQRLTDELVGRMEIAVDTDEMAESLERFNGALSSIRDLIADLPLCLNNAAFRPGDTVLGPDGAIHVLGGWGQWSLEPIGATLPPRFANEENAAALLAKARERNPGIADDRVTAGHLILAGRCALLERMIMQGAMKAGLAVMERVLADLDAIRLEGEPQESTAPTEGC